MPGEILRSDESSILLNHLFEVICRRFQPFIDREFLIALFTTMNKAYRHKVDNLGGWGESQSWAPCILKRMGDGQPIVKCCCGNALQSDLLIQRLKSAVEAL